MQGLHNRCGQRGVTNAWFTTTQLEKKLSIQRMLEGEKKNMKQRMKYQSGGTNKMNNTDGFGLHLPLAS